MYFLLGVVFALWQWIQVQKVPRASPGIMLYVKITLVWLQSRVENGLPTVGNIHLIEKILSCQRVFGAGVSHQEKCPAAFLNINLSNLATFTT